MDNPFKPGARCALRDAWSNYTEVFVERVHKNGNFTLRGQGAQQWRPYSSGSGWQQDRLIKWHASKTGSDSWSRESLTIWDATTDAEISAHIAETQLKARLAKLQKRVERLRVVDVNSAMLDTIEGALLPVPGRLNAANQTGGDGE